MKKLAIIVLVILLTLSVIFGAYLYFSSIKTNITDEENLIMQEKIANNSSWIEITDDDINGYLNGTFTKSVETIIASLENAVPVIFQISSDKFSTDDKGTFIVASAFSSSGQVYVYYYNSTSNTYEKMETSLGGLLEDSIFAYIYDEGSAV